MIMEPPPNLKIMESKNDIRHSLGNVHETLEQIRISGVLNGENADRSENLHRLFIYPAMMVPKTQKIIVSAFADVIPEHANVIDPFLGSGTSLISCMEFGYNIYGQDINPLAVLIAQTKAVAYGIEAYEEAFFKIQGHINEDVSERIEVNFPNINKWFTHESQVSFSKIRRAIMALDKQEIRSFFWVVMAETIRVGCNDRTSTFKLHCRPKEELEDRKINNIDAFKTFCRRGINDLKVYVKKLSDKHLLEDGHYKGRINIKWGNSQQAMNTKDRFDLLVSSPPYGDNHTTVTYGQASYLPLQWIDKNDLDCPYDYLRTTQEIDAQSLGGKKNKKAMTIYRDRLFMQTPTLARFIESVPDKEKKLYDKTIYFINDFNQCLDKILKVMKDDAFYIWTIGDRFVGKRSVPNANILVDLMESRGLSLFDEAERFILNKKQPKKNNYSSTMEKERILIFHK